MFRLGTAPVAPPEFALLTQNTPGGKCYASYARTRLVNIWISCSWSVTGSGPSDQPAERIAQRKHRVANKAAGHRTLARICCVSHASTTAGRFEQARARLRPGLSMSSGLPSGQGTQRQAGVPSAPSVTETLKVVLMQELNLAQASSCAARHSPPLLCQRFCPSAAPFVVCEGSSMSVSTPTRLGHVASSPTCTRFEQQWSGASRISDSDAQAGSTANRNGHGMTALY